jgi:hypothetical protein
MFPKFAPADIDTMQPGLLLLAPRSEDTNLRGFFPKRERFF